MSLELSELAASLFNKKSQGLRLSVEGIAWNQLADYVVQLLTVTSHNDPARE